jgi:3-hydroxyisobutyrate dehydrogenase
VLVIMVHNAAQVDQVMFEGSGAVGTLAPGATVWLASTVAPAYAAALNRKLADKGIQFVDGPVSGGVVGAEAGSLSVIAGGDDKALADVASVMRACASHVFHVGPAGAGSTVKLINQMLTASHIALTAESLVMGTRAGIDPGLLIDVITHSAGTSRQFEARAPRMLAGDHTPHATVRTFLKDLGIALDWARTLDMAVPLTAAAHQIFTMAAGTGHADESDTTVVRIYEAFAGIDLAKGKQCR